MRLGRVVALSLSILSTVCNGQTVSQVTVAKDAQAVTIAAKAVAAMGSVLALAANDSRTIASVSPALANAASLPVVIETSGTKKIRLTTQMPQGTTVRIVNTGVGERIKPDGTIVALPLDATLHERVDHIPALSLLAEATDPAVEVLYVGTDTVNGATCNVISLSLPLIGRASDADGFRRATRTTACIDQATGLVVKMAYMQPNSPPSPGSFEIEQVYSNYQAVQGIAVPFTQMTFADGQLVSTISISSVQFNVGIPDSDFAVQGAN